MTIRCLIMGLSISQTVVFLSFYHQTKEERTQCANLADSGERVSEPVEGLICGDQPQADFQLRRGQPIIQGISWSCQLQTMRLIQLMIQAKVGS